MKPAGAARGWNPLALALTILPFLHILGIVAGNGEDNLSNDYLGWVGLVERVLGGTYPWTHYLGDAFIGGSHAMALPVAVHLLAARWTHWSHHAELAVGLLLLALKLALLAATARRAGLTSPWLGPALSLTVFCTAQTSVYTFAEVALQMGFCQAALALVVWAMVRYPGSTRAALLAGAGALAASWSWGGGLLVWGVALVGLPLSGLRRPRVYALLVPFLALSIWPYALNLAAGQKHLPGARFVLGLLGRAFCYGSALNSGHIPQAEAIGAFGLAAAVVVGTLAFTGRLRAALPGALLLGWSFLVTLQIGLAREQIAPWYASPASVFFTGLVLMSAALAAQASRVPRAVGVLVILAVVGLAANADRSWVDKSFYLRSHSPASAECLRRFQTAPTYCEAKLFEWEIGRPELLAVFGEPLRRRRLSVLAPRQERTMQGSVIFGEVAFQDVLPGQEDVRWARQREPKRLPWSEVERLNLFLRGPVRATWRFQVPEAGTARFVTAVARGRRSEADHAELLLHCDGAAEPFQRLALRPGSLWTPVEVDLAAHRGHEVTAVFAGVLPREDGFVVFRAPLLSLDGVVPPPAAPQTPINASTAPEAEKPPTCLEVPQGKDLLEAQPSPDGLTSFRLGEQPSLECWQLPPLLLAPLRRVSVVAAVREAGPRLLRIHLFIDGLKDPKRARLAEIPLLGDGVPRRYSYDLQLFEAWKETRVTGWTVEPVFPGAAAAGRRMALGPLVLE